MTVVEQIRACRECGRPTRSSKAKLADFPGTVVRGSVDRCMTCYQKGRPRRTAAAQGSTLSQLIGALSERHEPQRTDCRPSCCKTPYNCASSFHCRCHGEGS